MTARSVPSPKLTAYDRIQFAMWSNEQDLLVHIQTLNRSGIGLKTDDPTIGKVWRNAAKRLEQQGLIHYHHYWDFNRMGYWLTPAGRDDLQNM